ncbi:MAG: polymer-forming cytoskeletal protein [Cocleimonas sp.]|nr:polymer-forming cytoskeletal protein [Cocleimonas sp.]
MIENNLQELLNNDTEHSILKSNTKLMGDLFFSGVLRVFGHITGNIISSDNTSNYLILEKGSEINGEIRATNVLVYSKVSGDIFAFNRLSLKSEATIQGNVNYNELEMDQGATINGTLSAIEL